LIASTDSPRTAFSLNRGLLDVGIAVLAFVLVCAGLNALLPFPEIDVVSAELRFFQEHRDEFDTVFIGSSRIHHQVSPAIFDRVMADAGHPTRTFNFGINGMFPPESGFLLERLLRTKPRRLKWVFIELDELETRRIPKAEASRRSLYWHDWKRTSLVLRKILDGDNQRDARDLFFFHTALFAKNFANIGRKIDLSWWSSHLGKKAAAPKTLGQDGDGYVPQIKRMSEAETVAYEAGLEHAVTQAEFRPVSPSTGRAYRQWANEVRKTGATPIFLVTPTTAQTKLQLRSESGIAGVVMQFNDAKDYPQLYRNEIRVDADHLNGPGAEEFTRLIADNLSRLINDGRIQ
jgi:hypothetical protein